MIGNSYGTRHAAGPRVARGAGPHGHGAEGPHWGHEEPVDRTLAASYPLRHEAFVAGLHRPMTLEDES